MEQPVQRKHVNIYIEGLSIGEPGPGGWGCILEFGEHRREMSDHMAGTTGDRMVLFALISGLGALKQPCNVSVFTTSASLSKTLAGEQPPVDPNLWKILKLQCRNKHRICLMKDENLNKNPLVLRCHELAEQSIGEYKRLNNCQEENS